jgi:DNA transformation protein
MNNKDESFRDFILDQLQELDDVEARRMFGGYGVYRDETFFGIIHKGKLYFKIDESTLSEYRKRRLKPFRPTRGKHSKVTTKFPSRLLKMMSSFVSGR